MKRNTRQNAAVAVVPQSYAAYQGGPMFFPSVIVSNAEAMFAGAMATPSVNAGKVVHSVPVTYAMPTVSARPMSLPFAITPQGIVQ